MDDLPAARRLAHFDDFASINQLPYLHACVQVIDFPIEHWLR
jgi:hypothetical protein